MCLSDIGRVAAVMPARYSAIVDIDGREVAVSTVALGLDDPDIGVGDWVVVHTGLAVERLAESDVRQILHARSGHAARNRPGGRPS